MGKTCNNCNTDGQKKASENMPNVTFSAMSYEEHENRHERRERRLWVSLIVAIVMIFVSNAAWMIYESTFDTYYYDQTSEGVNNVNYGEQGDLNNVPKIESETSQE